ncbi:MAG: hypothetical protein PHP55_07695 [Methanoculleus sp.]|nr:hypothetical protein [Clostridia bacterium]MDD3933728.1 hypothetical protein [Methanoculleus sp.]
MKPSAKICDEIRCPNYHIWKSECGVTGTIPGHMKSCPKGRINSYEELVEEIARFEHLQWVEWSKAIAESESIAPERLARWEKLWVPYSRLPEEQKESDRKYARRVLKHLFKQGSITVNAYPLNRVSGSTFATEKRGGYGTALKG